MKNEIGKPTQKESHIAMGTFHYLDCAIKCKEYLWEDVSDNFMINRLPHLSPNTVRSIRKRLQKEGVLEEVKEKQPNNEKLYRITDLQKAYTHLDQYLGIHLDKQEPKVFFFPKFAILEPGKFTSGYFQVINKSSKNKLPKAYPKQLYEYRLCPSCSNNSLRAFKHNGDELDRKCHNCKITFHHSNGIIRVTSY